VKRVIKLEKRQCSNSTTTMCIVPESCGRIGVEKQKRGKGRNIMLSIS
jgi:hypothetical protein